MHIGAPKSLTVLGVIRWVATLAAGAFLGGLIDENVRHLAEERHWNEYPTWGLAKMPDLAPLFERHDVWFGFGVSIGIAASLWLVKLFPLKQARLQDKQDIERMRFERSACVPVASIAGTAKDATLPARGGEVSVQSDVSAGAGSKGKGGDARIEGGDGGAGGGNVTIGPGNYTAGPGGAEGGAGGDLIIKGGDATNNR